MPKVRVITGNYKQVAERILPTKPAAAAGFIADSDDITDQLLKDLDRQLFVPTNKYTFKEHLDTWLHPRASKSYSQGNISASFYKLVLNMFILNPKFPQTQATKGSPPREVSTYGAAIVNGDISFAYFDDNGIPCGVSIAYSTLDPALWTAAIIRNTTAAPEDRQVLLISPEELLQITQEDLKDLPDNLKKTSEDLMKLNEQGLTNAEEAQSTFLTMLGSNSLRKVFEDDLFQDDGTLNANKLNELKNKYPIVIPERAKIEKLRGQEQMIKKWPSLSPQEFTVVVETVLKKQTVKQKENSAKENEHYSQLKQNIQKHMHRAELDVAADQSFLRRHAISISVGIAALLSVISLVLILTGVLAPAGIVLGGIAAIIGIAAASTASVIAVGSGVKIALDQIELLNYQTELQSAEDSLDQCHQERMKNIATPPVIENDPEQIERWIIASDFSAEEFDQLILDVKKAGIAPVNPDTDIDIEYVLQDLKVITASSEVLSKAKKYVASITPPVKTSTIPVQKDQKDEVATPENDKDATVETPAETPNF